MALSRLSRPFQMFQVHCPTNSLTICIVNRNFSRLVTAPLSRNSDAFPVIFKPLNDSKVIMAFTQQRRSKAIKGWTRVHMDEMLVPKEPWDKVVRNRKQRYNMYIAMSVAFFLVTLIFGFNRGYLEHYGTPIMFMDFDHLPNDPNKTWYWQWKKRLYAKLLAKKREEEKEVAAVKEKYELEQIRLIEEKKRIQQEEMMKKEAEQAEEMRKEKALQKEEERQEKEHLKRKAEERKSKGEI